MSIQIDVPFQDKNLAKQKGAFWDNEYKTWYIPNGKSISIFEKWLPKECNAIIKAPILIAKSKRDCWKCLREIPVIAFAAKPAIIGDYNNEESTVNSWQIETDLILFSHVLYVPRHIINIVVEKFPFFKLTYSRTIGGKYWANTCSHCGSLQGDFHNHYEPGEAFSPTSFEEGKRIKLYKINYKHDVPIAGEYSYCDFVNTDNIEYISFSIY